MNIGSVHDGGDCHQERHGRRSGHDEAHYALLKLVHHYRQPPRVATYFDGRPQTVGEGQIVNGGMALRGTYTVWAPAAPAISSPLPKKNTTSTGVIAKFW
jgi:hypothetical protein